MFLVTLLCVACIANANLVSPQDGSNFPTLSVPTGGISMNNAWGGKVAHPAPGSQITFVPISSCKQHVVVRVTNADAPLDIKIGGFMLGTGLQAGIPTPVWCASAPGFPQNPGAEKLTFFKTGTTEAVSAATAIPANTFQDNKAYILDVTVGTDNSTAATVTQEEYLFTFAKYTANLYAPKGPKIGGVKWTMNCNPFLLTLPTICVLDHLASLPHQSDPYGPKGQQLAIRAQWVMYNQDGHPEYQDFQLGLATGAGEWTFAGFVEDTPEALAANMYFQVYGDFDPTVKYQILLDRCANAPDFNVAVTPMVITAKSMQAASPSPGAWHDVKLGSICHLTVLIPPPPPGSIPTILPFTNSEATNFIHQSEHNIAADAVVSDLILKSVNQGNHGTVYAAPNVEVTFTPKTTCEALAIVNQFDKPLNVVVNNTFWGSNIKPQHMTEMRCFNPDPNPVAWVIYDGADPTKMLNSGTLTPGKYNDSRWNVIVISQEQTDPTKPDIDDAADPWPLQSLNCTLHPPQPLQWMNFQLECPPPQGQPFWYLYQDVTCKIPTGVAPAATGTLLAQCLISFPNENDYPQTGGPVKKELTFFTDEVPYIGFVNNIMLPPGTSGITAGSGSEQVTALGMFQDTQGTYEYICKYIDSKDKVEVAEVEGKLEPETNNLLLCPAPDPIFKTYPVTAIFQVERRNINSAASVVLPSTDTTNPTVTILKPGNPNIFTPTSPTGHGGRTAGIVIGVLLGIAFVAGAAGAYVYFFRRKKHEGFVAIA